MTTESGLDVAGQATVLRPLVAEAIFIGLEASIRQMRAAMDRARAS